MREKKQERGSERQAYPQQPQPYAYPQQPMYPLQVHPDVHAVSVSVLSSSGATVAKVSYASVCDTGIPVTASGAAKREPGDVYDAETGRLLATSRALEILAGKLRRKANSRVRSADAIRRHHAEIRKRATEEYPHQPLSLYRKSKQVECPQCGALPEEACSMSHGTTHAARKKVVRS